MTGGSGNDNLTGGEGGDSLGGGEGLDNLDGGGGDDTLLANAGIDTVSGGDGLDIVVGGADTDFLRGGNDTDIFSFASGDSGVTAGSLDQILDWQVSDLITFGTGPAADGSDGNYIELSATSYADAQNLANSQIASNSKEYVVVQVGADVVVFADVDGGADDAEDAVVLVGRTLADISALNFL